MVTPSNQHPGLRLRLFYNDKVVHETNAAAISGELEIGRCSACAWAAPADDSLISSHHAILVREGREVTLRDKGSKNGTWFEGKRIMEKKLKAGDHLTLGHCVLKVEKETAEASAKHQAELEVMSGNQRREVKLISTERLSIGTSPEADLLLTDELVSRQHAVILRRNEDSYWLKALATTNGTKVNDVPLRADQERLLQNGDRIALAHVELIFRDGTGHRDHGQALRRLAVMAAAVVVFMSLYFGLQLARSSAATAIVKAQALKEAGKFSQARAVLDSAINRRGYRNVQMNADLLRIQLAKCETTSMQWEAIQQQLQKENWANAATQLGSLQSLYNDNDAWSWHDGPPVRERARRVKTWLDAYLDSGHSETLSMSALTDCVQRLDAAIKELASQKDYATLRTAAIERQKNLQQLALSYSGLNLALQKLGQPNLPEAAALKKVLAEIEKSCTNPAVPVRQKAETLLPLARQLAASYAQLNQAARLARELHFKEAEALAPMLPLPEECMVDGNLFDFRRNLEGAWANFKSELLTVSRLITDLSNQMDSPEADQLNLLYWRDQKVLTRIFACDSLAGPFPKRTRTEPAGEYDRALGIEYFYTSLRSLGSQSSGGWQESAFETKLMAARHTVAAARAIVNYFPTASTRAQWQEAKIKQWIEAAHRILQLQANLVTEFSQRSNQAEGRDALIAGGIALQLMDDPEAILSKTLAGQMATLRATILEISNQRDSATSTQRIDLRNQILKIGLPGDPVVNQMWIESRPAN